MKIRLNGEAYEIAGPLSVSALLSQLDIDSRRVAVERNVVVLKRTEFDSTIVAEGDEIEIVNFVGGGAWDAQLRTVHRTWQRLTL